MIKRKIKSKKTHPKNPTKISFAKSIALFSLVGVVLLGFKANIPINFNSTFSLSDLESLGKVAGANEIKNIPTIEKSGPELVNKDTLFPSISSKSALVIDLTTNKELYNKNAEIPLPPASTTKIITALLALEEMDLSKKVVVNPECTILGGNNVGFKAGDTITVEGLLYGLLVRSAADAACVLANADGSYERFINKMNQKANALGLNSTHFTNEVGFDADNGTHLSTAYDLSVLGREALKNDVFRKIVGTKETSIDSSSNGKTYYISNTNELLFTLPGTTGVKTGYTEKALGCLVFSYENLGKKILIVVMGSSDRFGDTEKLLNWVLSSFRF